MWGPVLGFEGIYEVSSSGSVRSIPHSKQNKNGAIHHYQGRVLKPSTSKAGYKRVQLFPFVGPGKTREIHALVAEAFLGPRPTGLFVCHRNDVPDDNRLSNLYYGTQSENMYDKVRNGGDHNRRKTHCPLGHALVTGNLRKWGSDNGWRNCLACHRGRSDVHNGRYATVKEAADARYNEILEGARH